MTREENTLLLMCCAHHDQLLREAIAKTGDRPLFDNIADPCSTFIWGVLRDCRESADAFPTRPLVELEVNARLEQLSGLEESFKETVRGTLRVIYETDRSETSVAIGRSFLETALQESLAVDWAERISRLGSLEEMREYVNQTASSLAKASTTEEALVKPLMDPGRFLVRMDRRSYGIRVLDLVTGGGQADGETIGMLGPTGGGKTVFAVGLACEKAMRGHHSMIVSYEQPAEGDITERLCSYMTGEEIDRFRDKTLDDLEPGLREAVLKRQAAYGRYISVIDLAKPGRGVGGADELTGHIDGQIEKGEKPTLVIVDWLGAMVQRYLAENNLENGQYRLVAQTFLDKMKAHAQANGYGLWINHQLNTGAARASSQSKPKATDAYEFKAFSFFMDACVCLGTLDPDSRVGWLILDKARRGAVGDIMVRLDGAHVRFEQATGYVTDHRGRFIEVDAGAPDIDAELDEGPMVSEVYRDAFPT